MTNVITALSGGTYEKEKSRVLFKMNALPYIFIAGGFIGTVYEFVLTLITKGVVEDHTGSILTPFNYVYGVGALIMFLVLHRIQNSLAIFSVGCVLGGVVEFGLSFVQEQLFGTISWDYSEEFLNICGRTTVPFMIVWGGLCLIAIKGVFPLLLMLIHKIPKRVRKAVAIVIVVIMCFDVLVTFTAVFRYTQRAEGFDASNRVIEYVDMLFDDSFMAVHFPNMKAC